MIEENKNITDPNKTQIRNTHLTKIKNEFISFLLKEIRTHLDNLNEARLDILNSSLSDSQITSLDQIKSESDHSYILIDEILSFLDVDSLRFTLDDLQFDLKDYFDKRKNNNFSKDLAVKYPLNILLHDNDSFDQKFARIVFENLGYFPDFCLSLNSGINVEYDLIFIDLSKSKAYLREISDTIYAYFGDKKRPYIIGLLPSNETFDNQENFEHAIDHCLVKPVKMRDLIELIELSWKKGKTEILRPVHTYAEVSINEKLIEEDKISFIQEIQSEEDIVFFIELIDIFIVETPKIVKIVREAIANKDFEKIHFGGHKLRGSSLTMGIELFIDIGAQLEKTGREGNLENAEYYVNQLEHKLIKVVEELEEIKVRYRSKYLSDFE